MHTGGFPPTTGRKKTSHSAAHPSHVPTKQSFPSRFRLPKVRQPGKVSACLNPPSCLTCMSCMTCLACLSLSLPRSNRPRPPPPLTPSRLRRSSPPGLGPFGSGGLQSRSLPPPRPPPPPLPASRAFSASAIASSRFIPMASSAMFRRSKGPQTRVPVWADWRKFAIEEEIHPDEKRSASKKWKNVFKYCGTRSPVPLRFAFRFVVTQRHVSSSRLPPHHIRGNGRPPARDGILKLSPRLFHPLVAVSPVKSGPQKAVYSSTPPAPHQR